MISNCLRALIVSAVLCTAVLASSDDEVTLFSNKGKAIAYIAFDDEMTIFTWSGKPVAYLERDSNSGFHVWGFNGKHVGWFVKGVIWDEHGDATCAVKERLQSTEFQPFKSFKEFKPFKAFKEFAPARPAFSNSFGSTSCRSILMEGAE